MQCLRGVGDGNPRQRFPLVVSHFIRFGFSSHGLTVTPACIASMEQAGQTFAVQIHPLETLFVAEPCHVLNVFPGGLIEQTFESAVVNLHGGTALRNCSVAERLVMRCAQEAIAQERLAVIKQQTSHENRIGAQRFGKAMEHQHLAT
ncbi:hypothetical protein D3C84_882150 [compost metagenome]